MEKMTTYMISADQGEDTKGSFCNCFTDDRGAGLEMMRLLQESNMFQRAVMMDVGQDPIIVSSYGLPDGETHLPGLQHFTKKDQPCLKLIKN